jgi:hypothetical protein
MIMLYLRLDCRDEGDATEESDVARSILNPLESGQQRHVPQPYG